MCLVMLQHWLHPYPTPEEKRALADDLGLSVSNVSRWFANARMRKWAEGSAVPPSVKAAFLRKNASYEDHCVAV